MTGTITAVFLAMLAFVGGHFLLSWAPLRGALVARLGERVFAGVYSVLMVVSLVWVVAAYRVAPPHVIYDLGSWVNLVPIVSMPFALMLAATGLIGGNPTALMGDRLLGAGAAPSGIQTITRHPFLSGAALWALAHLLANGDLASIILFGGFAILSIGGMAAIDSKRALKLGERWAAFAARTSRTPFAAALAGKTRVDWAGVGWLRPAIGLVLYAVLYLMHDRLFGVPVVVVW
jgi:uncharacterized membrane protein